MRRKLLGLDLIYLIIIITTFMLLSPEKTIVYNALIIGIVVALIVIFNSFYLNHKWFRHIDEIDNLIKNMKKEDRISIGNLSSEKKISSIQSGLVELSRHIELMATKYGYRKGQLEAILSSLSIGLVAVTETGEVIFHNPAFYDIYKLSVSMQGQSITNINDSTLSEIIKNATTSDVVEVINVEKKDGLIYNFKGIEIRSEGNKIGTLILIEDVTKIQKIDKMKSDFVSNVTHELKTPLTSIKGFAETLKNIEPTDKFNRDRFLGIIEEESERLSILINDILYLSEVEGSHCPMKESVDINKVVRSVMEISKTEIKEGVTLKFEATKNYFVTFEKYRLKQMLLNIISNSVRYTDEGSVRIILEEDKKNVILKVIDTGIGIPTKDQGRIFERFYRVDKDRSRLTGGTGLGLSIAKHIAERNQCNIHLESKLGVGTEVTILIKK